MESFLNWYMKGQDEPIEEVARVVIEADETNTKILSVLNVIKTTVENQSCKEAIKKITAAVTEIKTCMVTLSETQKLQHETLKNMFNHMTSFNTAQALHGALDSHLDSVHFSFYNLNVLENGVDFISQLLRAFLSGKGYPVNGCTMERIEAGYSQFEDSYNYSNKEKSELAFCDGLNAYMLTLGGFLIKFEVKDGLKHVHFNGFYKFEVL